MNAEGKHGESIESALIASHLNMVITKRVAHLVQLIQETLKERNICY